MDYQLSSRSRKLFLNRTGLYVAVAGIPYAVLLVIAYVCLQVLHWPVDPEIAAGDPVASWNSLTWTNKILAISAIHLCIWAPFYLAGRGLGRIAADQLSNHKTSLGAALSDMGASAPGLLIYSLLVGYLSMIGGSVLFIPCILVFPVLFSLVVPVSTIESRRLRAAIGRGFSLLRRVVGRTVVTFLAFDFVFVVAFTVRIVLDHALPDFPAKGYATIGVFFGLILVPTVLLNICLTLLCYEAIGKGTSAATATSADWLSRDVDHDTV